MEPIIETTSSEKLIDCGRCGGQSRSAELLFHLSWRCVPVDAWLVAAVSDRRARPDRYRQAKKDLGVRTVDEALRVLLTRVHNSASTESE